MFKVPAYSLKAVFSLLHREGESKRRQHDLLNVRVRSQSLGRPRQPESIGQMNRERGLHKERGGKILRESSWSLGVNTDLCLHEVKLHERGKTTTTSSRPKEFLELIHAWEGFTLAPARGKDM